MALVGVMVAFVLLDLEVRAAMVLVNVVLLVDALGSRERP